MSAEFVAILRQELETQRRFLSSDEEQALLRPATYENEDDLAFEQVKHRQRELVGALRNRFIRDGRPLDRWWDLLAAQEALHGERTLMSAMAVQVLDWSARTADQRAMLGGFASKLLRLGAYFISFFAVFVLAQGVPVVGVVLLVLSAGLWLGARIMGNLTADRVDDLVESYKHPRGPSASV